MKTAIKLVLIYFAMQILGVLIAGGIGLIYAYYKHGTLNASTSSNLAEAMLLGFLFMIIYLWKNKYMTGDRQMWASLSPFYLLGTILMGVSMIVLVDGLVSQLSFLPNWMENTFDMLQTGWLGIFCIAVLGPILEEILFRGAITKALLRRYNPTKAIVLSALIFGIFHLNPVQVVGATCSGLFFAWIYYKTRSLIPCIIIHIMNNSLSVYLSLRYPDVDYAIDLIGVRTYLICILVAAALLVVAWKMVNGYRLPNTNTTEV